jgi:hypothetical protein
VAVEGEESPKKESPKKTTLKKEKGKEDKKPELPKIDFNFKLEDLNDK